MANRNDSYYTKKSWREAALKLVGGDIGFSELHHHHCKCGKDWSHYQDIKWCKKQGELGQACDDCFFGMVQGG